jgi:hypothetical protein
MDTGTIIIIISLVVNVCFTILDVVATTLLHFRFRSKCGKFGCLASPVKSPGKRREGSPTVFTTDSEEEGGSL